MKNLILFSALILIVSSCNVPKDGEGENVPTSKLEVLTNLGDDDTTNISKDKKDSLEKTNEHKN